MNGPLKFLTARKNLPLLDLLAKFIARAPQIFALLASSQSKFFISARARKKIAVLGMLANARKDHSSPLDLFCPFEVARHPGSVCVELQYGIVLRDKV